MGDDTRLSHVYPGDEVLNLIMNKDAVDLVNRLLSEDAGNQDSKISPDQKEIDKILDDAVDNGYAGDRGELVGELTVGKIIADLLDTCRGPEEKLRPFVADWLRRKANVHTSPSSTHHVYSDGANGRLPGTPMRGLTAPNESCLP